MIAPRHCCHAPDESCDYGWSDVHYHRCVPPERPASAPVSDPGALGVHLEVQR